MKGCREYTASSLLFHTEIIIFKRKASQPPYTHLFLVLNRQRHSSPSMLKLYAGIISFHCSQRGHLSDCRTLLIKLTAVEATLDSINILYPNSKQQ